MTARRYLLALPALLLCLLLPQCPGAPATAQTPPPTPGVGYTHADLVDDPCPASAPNCTDHRNQKVPIDWFCPRDNVNGLSAAVFQFSDGAGSSYGGHTMPGVSTGCSASNIPNAVPILVFSHGTAGHGIQNYSMYRDLAAKGYIVAAPTHRGNSLIDVGLGLPIDGFGTTITKRNLDMLFTVNITNALFGSKVKRDQYSDPKVAAIGHSLGAMTALTQPTGLNAFLMPDARIDAVVGISSSVYLFDVAGLDSAGLLSSLHKPTMLINQMADGITPTQFTNRVQEEIAPVYVKDRLDIYGAEHNATTDVGALKESLDVSTTPQPAKDAVSDLVDQTCADYAPNCVQMTHTVQVQRISSFLAEALA